MAIQVDCADDLPDLRKSFANLKEDVAILTKNSEKQLEESLAELLVEGQHICSATEGDNFP